MSFEFSWDSRRERIFSVDQARVQEGGLRNSRQLKITSVKLNDTSNNRLSFVYLTPQPDVVLPQTLNYDYHNQTELDALTHEVSKYNLSEIETIDGGEDALYFIPKSNTRKGNRIGEKVQLERDQPNPISNVILAYLLWAEEVETELDEYLLKLGVFQKEITKQIKQGGERYVITNLRKQQKELQYDMHHLGEQALQIDDFVAAVNDAITKLSRDDTKENRSNVTRRRPQRW